MMPRRKGFIDSVRDKHGVHVRPGDTVRLEDGSVEQVACIWIDRDDRTEVSLVTPRPSPIRRVRCTALEVL